MPRKSSNLIAPPVANQVSTNQEVTPVRYMDIKQAALYTSSHPWAIRSLIYARAIKFSRLGRKYILDRNDIDDYMNEIKQGSQP